MAKIRTKKGLTLQKKRKISKANSESLQTCVSFHVNSEFLIPLERKFANFAIIFPEFKQNQSIKVKLFLNSSVDNIRISYFSRMYPGNRALSSARYDEGNSLDRSSSLIRKKHLLMRTVKFSNNDYLLDQDDERYL